MGHSNGNDETIMVLIDADIKTKNTAYEHRQASN